jgi:hypothetical protein
MSTILDIIVSEESSIIVNPEYLELVKETFKFPLGEDYLGRKYQEKTVFTEDERVIFDKIDEVL